MKLVALDFDGVIHSYTSGWTAADVIPDLPIPGAIAFINALLDDDRFQVCVYSSRSNREGGIAAMREYIHQHGVPKPEIDQVLFVTEKPQAALMIDDRGFQFRGEFPTLDEVDAFRPWRMAPQRET